MRRQRFGCTGGGYQTFPAMQQNTTSSQCMNNQGVQTGVNQNGYFPQMPTVGMNGTTTYQELTPIMTCSKNVVNQYHVTKQPYVHTYHTEVVHHHITQAEYIPNYTCSEVHVNDTPYCGR